MTLGINIRYLIGGSDNAEFIRHFQAEAKRLASMATRSERKGYLSEAQEIRERVAICKRYVQEYREIEEGN